MAERDERIFDANDLAKRDGCKSHREWINNLCKHQAKRNILDTPFTGKVSGDPVNAFIDFGRWIAKCPDCDNGSEYVSSDEKIFYCFSCGNYLNNGDGRSVIFPDNKEDIEKELLERPQKFIAGGNSLARQFNAKPKYIGLSRTWHPDESIEDLKNQRLKAENGE